MTFTMWSFGHYMFLLSPFVFTYLLHKVTVNLTQEQKREVGIYLSVVVVGLLISRNVSIFISSDYQFNFELIPFQVCHFANIVLLYSFWKRSDVAFTLAFCLNLIAAFLSILFADGLEAYANILSVKGVAYIVGHMLIVVITAWAFLNDFIFIKIKTLYKTIIVVEIMIISSVIINNIMYQINGIYSNYFYTVVPAHGTPLEWWFNVGKDYAYGDFRINYIYILGLMVLFPLVTYIMYRVAKLFKKAE